MKIMIKKYDSTKVQYDFIEFDTVTMNYGTGNSGVTERVLNHDLVVTVTTNKEFNKQVEDLKNYYVSETL